MRSIQYFILLCLSLLSFSQRGITNKSHPFQVLFVEDATIEGRSLKQFDFLRKQDVLLTKGEIVLVHYSSRVYELLDTIVSLKSLDPKIKNYWTSRPILDIRAQDSRGACKDCIISRIIFPPKHNYIHNSVDSLRLLWLKNHDSDNMEYRIDVVDIFDKPLFHLYTQEDYCVIPPEKIQTKEGLVIIKINGVNDTGVKIEENYNSKFRLEYQTLFTAIGISFSDEKIANQLFLKAINQSNQDPRFIQFYEDFLERNPQFKAETE